MKKQDLRVSANNLRSVSRNPDISIRRKVHVARSRRFVSSVDPSSKSVDSFGENIIQPHKIPSADVFSEAAAFALLALAISVFAFFPRLFLLDLEVF
jgi:hypothetical protein